jgi:hypothetical protein
MQYLKAITEQDQVREVISSNQEDINIVVNEAMIELVQINYRFIKENIELFILENDAQSTYDNIVEFVSEDTVDFINKVSIILVNTELSQEQKEQSIIDLIEEKAGWKMAYHLGKNDRGGKSVKGAKKLAYGAGKVVGAISRKFNRSGLDSQTKKTMASMKHDGPVAHAKGQSGAALKAKKSLNNVINSISAKRASKRAGKPAPKTYTKPVEKPAPKSKSKPHIKPVIKPVKKKDKMSEAIDKL